MSDNKELSMDICLHTIWEIKDNFIGGTERFLVDIGKELQALGHNPTIVCSSLNAKYFVEGVRVVGYIPERYRSSYSKYESANPDFFRNEVVVSDSVSKSLRQLSKYSEEQLRGIQANVFHLNSFASASFVHPKERTVVTNHENELECDGLWGEGFFDAMSKLIREKKTRIHEFDALATPSRYYAEIFENKLDTKVLGINLGISLINFKIKKKSSKSNALRVLLPSRFDMHQKGHDIAIKACAILKNSGLDVTMIFTGLRDDYKANIPEFRRLLHEENVSDRIKITRYHDINEAYSECDLVISPERYCSYGLSISESLAVGLPTVLSDIPTYTEIANNYNHAFFFKSESAESLADTIKKASSTVSADFSEDAIAFRINYDLRECAKQYHRLYTAS